MNAVHSLIAHCALSIFVCTAFAAIADKRSRMPAVDISQRQDPAGIAGWNLLQSKTKSPRNIHKLLALSPELLEPLLSMAAAMRNSTTVARRHLELAILRTSLLAHGDYEFQQHREIARSCGVHARQIEALAQWRSSSEFDARERALLGYIDESVGGANVEDDTFARLQGFYSERQILELTFVSAIYGAVAQITRSYRVPLDLPAAHEQYGRC